MAAIGGYTEGGYAEGGYAEGGYAEGGYAEGGYAEGGAGAPIGGDAGAGGGATCEVNGKSYRVGERFGQGCSSCTCAADGSISCDERLCVLRCQK